MTTLATAAQKDFIRELCVKLGYDCDDYLLIGLTKNEASEVITKLANEWEG